MTSRGPILKGLSASLLLFIGIIQKILDDMRGIQENPKSHTSVVLMEDIVKLQTGRLKQIPENEVDTEISCMRFNVDTYIKPEIQV